MTRLIFICFKENFKIIKYRYVNVPSLKRFLFARDPKAPLFFGEQLISFYGQRYMTGGGGYVLSRVALDKFVALLKDNRTDEEVGCDRSKDTSEEDPSICTFFPINIFLVYYQFF
jgi:hypothetical protein